MGDERKPYESSDLEEVMRADDETEQTASRDLVTLIVVLPEFGKEVVVIEVSGESDESKSSTEILEIDGRFRKS